MVKRYTGEFVSVAGVLWRVELWLEESLAYSDVGDLVFDYPSPLVIEWPEKAKHEPVCGSTATLRVVSPGDRSFFGLADCEDGTCRLDVYREGSLYWSGTIDPDQYAEPYERLDDYVVELSFSDFGRLDRIDFSLSGLVSVRSLATQAVSLSGIRTSIVNASMASTTVSGTSALDRLHVLDSNFYDEEGTPVSMLQALKSTLQPLGLRMIQRNGTVWLYDINGLAAWNQTGHRQLAWSSTRQTLGKDATYKKLIISWSPYSGGTDVVEAVDPWGKTPETPDDLLSDYNSTSVVQVPDAKYYSVVDEVDKHKIEGDDTNVGFTMWLKDSAADGAIEPQGGAKVFKVVPVLSGSECEGIAVCAPSSSIEFSPEKVWTTIQQCCPAAMLDYNYTGPQPVLADTGWHPIAAGNSSLALRLKMKSIFSGWCNPFNAQGDTEEWPARPMGKDQARLGSIIYVPVVLTFEDAATGNLYVWNNRRQALEGYHSLEISGGNHLAWLKDTLGKWEAASDNYTYAPGYIAYYQESHFEQESDKPSLPSSWLDNRQAVHYNDAPAAELRKADPGQLIPYPPGAGRIRLQILGQDLYAPLRPQGITLHEACKWWLFQAPSIDVVKKKCSNNEIDTSDYVYEYAINSKAREDLEISTVCGMGEEFVPMAKGAYYLANSEQQHTATRAGRTMQVEDLLASTLYSQYAERKNKISGEADIVDWDFRPVTEANQGEKIFMITKDTQDLKADTSDISIVEVRPDEYDMAHE